MSIKEKLHKTKEIFDHPKYHPEGTVFDHIQITMLRALLFTYDIDLILAALFHDICKPDSGEYRDFEGVQYWRNLNHADEAAKYIEGIEVRNFINKHRGNSEIIKLICANHMRVKHNNNLLQKVSRWIPEIETFVKLDDSINRYDISSISDYVSLPGVGKILGVVTFVGQSPVQRRFRRKDITITVNRTPFVYHFSDIPLIFAFNGYDMISELINIQL